MAWKVEEYSYLVTSRGVYWYGIMVRPNGMYLCLVKGAQYSVGEAGWPQDVGFAVCSKVCRRDLVRSASSAFFCRAEAIPRCWSFKLPE